MSYFWRRAGLVVVSGGAYAAATYLTYSYVTAGKKDQERVMEEVTATPGFYTNDPCRTRTFQKIAYGYDDQIDRDEFVMGINLLRRALLYFHAKGKVLEIGAGTGRNVSYYPRSVDKIVMTDASDQMLERAQAKIKRKAQNQKFEAMVADAADLSKLFPDQSFDTVVDTFGLCSFDDPVVVLKEMQRVCKPDGKILLLEHGRSKSYEGLTKYLDHHAERHAKNWGCVWNRDIDQIVKEAGLKLERKDTWHFGTTYYVVCRPNHLSQSQIADTNSKVMKSA